MLLHFFYTHKVFGFIGIAGIILAVAVAAYSLVLLNQQTFYDGIVVDGIDLGKMDIEKARTILYENFDKKYKNRRIILKYKNIGWPITTEDISFKFLVDDALERAYSYGRTGNAFRRLQQILSLKRSNVVIMSEPSLAEDSLSVLMSRIKREIDREGKNAWISYQDGEVKINREVTGLVFDVDENLQKVRRAILSGSMDEIELTVDKVDPGITYDKIKDIKDVLSSFSTVFNPYDINRTHNVRLACEKIDGKILMPGDIFSMNSALGPRTEENGYKEARIVYKNEYIDGIGGGICQTTTTLYNSVLKSRLKIVEREHHSLPSLYVGLGQDATIAGDYIDFKFQNNRDYPVCISAEIVKNKIIIRVLGRKEADDRTVKLVPVIAEEYEPEKEDIIIDNSLPDGEKVVLQKSRKGFKVHLYRYTYDDKGDILNKELVSTDIYKPVRGQIKVNENYKENEAMINVPEAILN